MAAIRYEELDREVSRKLSTIFDRLKHVWDEIGLDAAQRKSRTEIVVAHLKNLLEEMAMEEESLRDRLMNDIKKYAADLLRLSKELSLAPYEPAENLTNVQLEKDLRKKVSSLEQECRDRLKQLASLKKEEQHLCDILCATPIYVVSGKVPSLEQLKDINQHIEELKKEKEHRYTIFTSTKKNILKMLEDLEQCPNTSFERELICEEDDSFLLTKDNMNSLKQYCDELESQQKENFSRASKLREHMETLWERISIDEEERLQFRTNNAGFKPKVIAEIKKEIARCEVLKLEKMQQVIENMRKELVLWWDKCYVSQTERDAFLPFSDKFYTEECLQKHEAEVQMWKTYYEKNTELLALVEKWQKLFEQYVEYDRKEVDPNRFFNRGCNLLKEEKARKKVMKELPRVQEEVGIKIKEWETSTGRQFLVGGTQFTKYIENKWEAFHHHKEQEKIHRQQAKAKLMEEELKFGSRPATTTPGKKRLIGLGTTPGKTPTKRFKQENGTPLLVNSVTLSSVSGSSVSSAESSVRRGRVIQHPVRKMNDTTKTPTAITPGMNRTGRTNHTSVFSPVCMSSRSTYKPKTSSASRKALTENNVASSNDTGFSQTTVSSAATAQAKVDDNPEASLESVGLYTEFARGLNQNARPNCRSSVLPSQLQPAFF